MRNSPAESRKSRPSDHNDRTLKFGMNVFEDFLQDALQGLTEQGLFQKLPLPPREMRREPLKE